MGRKRGPQKRGESVKNGGRRGQVLPLVGLFLTMLLGAAALAVDVGYLQYQQRTEQTAADSAAVAGASELQYGNAAFATAALTDSASNGFTNNGTTVVVTVNNPPATGPNAGNHNAVEVIVTAKYPTFFENVFKMALATVSSRAVVVNVNRTTQCFYLLGTSSSNIDSDTLTSTTCGLTSNGSWTMNQSTVNMTKIGYAGSGNSQSQDTFTNAQPSAQIAVADPCPTITGCAYLTANPPATSPCTYTNVNLTTNSTINPGVYCGPINANNLNLTMSPGLYVFTSGVNFSGGTVTGTGVTWYVPSGAINIQNTSHINLSAPTTGVTAGILMFQPPSNTNVLNWSGFIGTGTPGVIYAPSATLTSNGINFTAVDLILGSANISTSTFTFPAGGAVPGDTQSVLSE
jgi:hypothetical protein